jgi:hypothetical protein
MGVLYADRGFISINGVEVLDVENIQYRVSDGTKPVGTMTRNRRNKGFVKGNREVTCAFGIAVQQKLGTPKLENVDFDSNDVALTFEQGADRYTITGLNHADTEQSASGVGSEGKKNFNLVGTDIIDQVGNSALFPTSLSSITGG